MIIFNDGVPGAGKSYNCVAEHIVPAVARGRHVWYRLKGLDHGKIAEHLGLPLEQVNALLHHVKTDDVNSTFRAFKDAGQEGEWVCPPELQNALIVIDEVHEFYQSSRQPMHPAEEQFFAKHRHHGIDILIMTQSYKSLHSGVRRRVERMTRFQKLTAVGMEGHCRATHYHAVAPEKFEKVDATTFKYEPAFFAMYKGYAGGDVKADVYKQGGRTVWARLRWKIVVAVLAVCCAVVVLVHFVHSGGGMVKAGSRAVPVQSATAGGAVVAPRQPAPTAVPVSRASSGPDLSKMPPDVRYVWSLSERGRARLAGLAVMPGHAPMGVVEWREGEGGQAGQGGVVDRLSLQQIQALGVSVVLTDYGVRLSYGKDAIIVTAWPLADPVQQSQSQQSPVAASTPVAQVPVGEGPGTSWPGASAGLRAVYVPPDLLPAPSAAVASGGHY